jgi:ABC-type uncharacterized transport system YnjBCD ATPase subunit
MLVAEGLRKRYRSREVVRDFGLTLNAGEVVGLLGPNGAGKTTCFYMIVGLVRADAGRIVLDGVDITDADVRRARLGVGYLPQEPSVFRRLSVEDNMLAWCSNCARTSTTTARDRAGALLAELQINARAPRSRRQPVRRRAPARGDRARAGRQAALHAARRAVRRRRPDLGGTRSSASSAPQGPRHRRADHRPQRARDARHLRPRLHPARGHRAGRRLARRHPREPAMCRDVYLGEKFTI